MRPVAHSGVSLAVLVLLAVPVGCGPEAFASIVLNVREAVPPGGEKVRLTTANTLAWQLDGDEGRAPSVTFKPGDAVATPPIALGQSERLLTVELRVGNPEAPVRLGRALNVVVPAIGVPAELVTFGVPVILGPPDVPALVDEDRPNARDDVVMCMDPTGKGWIFGGFSDGEAQTNAYAFSLDNLRATDTILNDLLEGVSACDGDGTGQFVLIETACGRDDVDSTAPGLLSVGTDRRASSVTLPTGCQPVVSVAGNAVWVVVGDRVQLRRLGDLELVAEATLDASARSLGIALSDTQVLLAAPAGTTGTVVFTAENNTLIESVGPPVQARAFTRHAGDAYMLDAGGQVFKIDAERASNGRTVSTENIDANGLAMLSSGAAVVLGPDKLVVEGGKPIVHGGRTALGVTVGDVVLLTGGPAGVDAVVPSRVLLP